MPKTPKKKGDRTKPRTKRKVQVIEVHPFKREAQPYPFPTKHQMTGWIACEALGKLGVPRG